MGSTAYNDIYKLTADNQGLRDISELLFLDILRYGSLAEIVDMNYGLLSGKMLGGVGEFGLVGEKKNLCKPSFNNTKLDVTQKIWELGPLVIAEELCADDFEETIARFCMQTGTDRADMTDTDIMTMVIIPRLKTAIEKAVWRVVWLGDTSAAYVADSGSITDNPAFKLSFFNVADGLFKRLYNITATNPDQRITIDANQESTFALQRSKLLDKGVAIGIFDKLIYEASPILTQDEGARIYCTSSLAGALANDIRKSNSGSDLQWESHFDGSLVYSTRYLDVEIIKVPMWDSMIQSFENQGSAIKDPHRAIFCKKECLQVGFGSNESYPNMKMWFSDDDQTNKILASDTVGTLTWQDELIKYAY